MNRSTPLPTFNRKAGQCPFFPPVARAKIQDYAYTNKAKPEPSNRIVGLE
jgi:hypothetical protein